jgi:hypothetical protein
MTARHRQRTGPTIVGHGRYGGVDITPSSRTTWSEVCDDVVGNYGGENPFVLQRTETVGGLLNYSHPSTSNYFKDCPVNFNPGGYIPVPSSASLITRVMSSTGPLTPSIYLPVSVFEFRDIPAMLRHAGNLLHKIKNPSGLNPLKEAGAATLAYQFGWGPLMQDIGKMLQFAALVQKKQEQLMKANSRDGIRRRISLGQASDELNSSSEIVWSTYGFLLGQKVIDQRTYKQWAVIHWKLRDPSQIGKPPTFRQAFDAALGTSKGYIPIEVWKAMPWSWAVDWFAGISDFMQASHNMLYYMPSRLSIMTYRKNVKSFSAYVSKSIPGLSITEGSVTTENKARAVHTPLQNISLRLPFMDNFKLSIIGGLTAARL